MENDPPFSLRCKRRYDKDETRAFLCRCRDEFGNSRPLRLHCYPLAVKRISKIPTSLSLGGIWQRDEFEGDVNSKIKITSNFKKSTT